MKKKIEKIVSQYIHSHNLLEHNKKYLVALSGGADSVALLMMLQQLGYQIEAAHCNFKLREEESDRDEKFCQQLCHELHIPLHLIHFETTTYAQLHHVSIEMAARDLRYGYFANLCRDLQTDGICVAHHNDDNVETLFINLIRGTGLHGLLGMQPVNGNILRPFLCLSRHDILQYLAARNQTYITDSSNLVNDVTRNKIRLDLIPFLQTINPAVVNNISRTMAHLQEIRKIVDYSMEEHTKNMAENHVIDGRQQLAISKTHLLSTPSPQYSLFQTIIPYGFSSSQVDNILHSIHNTTGKRWHSPTHTLIINREHLLIERTMTENEMQRSMKITETGNYCFSNNQKFVIKRGYIDNQFSISRLPHFIHLDSSKISFPLIIRHIQSGDRFTPLGMTTSKLVSDYLTDKKKSWFDKQHQLVITDDQNRILWLVNERIDNQAKITDQSTDYISIEYIRQP